MSEFDKKAQILEALLKMLKIHQKIEEQDEDEADSRECNCCNCKPTEDDEEEKSAMKDSTKKFVAAMKWAFGEDYMKKKSVKSLSKSWKELHPNLPELEFTDNSLELSIILPFQVAEHYFTRNNKKD